MPQVLVEPAALRDAFPYLQERAYLDTAAAGLCWRGHGEAVARFFDAVKSRGIDGRDEWQATAARVRERLARWLGVSPQDVCFVSSTTEALNLAARSLRLRPGQRIVMAADEFPSVAAAWQAAHGEQGGIAAVPIADEAAREAALLAALDERAGALVVSQTHWATGTTLDLDRLAAGCRAADALLVVDGIQALGAVPTDLALVDVYCASFFKWMLSGFGLGVLVSSPRARARMRPAYRGYGNLDDPGELQYAHVNLPALYGLEATLDFLDGVGWPTIFARVRRLGDHLVAGARERGLALRTPPAMRAGVFVLPTTDAEAVRARLADRGITVSARGAGIRVSPHFYNTPDEIDRCLDALVELAGRP